MRVRRSLRIARRNAAVSSTRHHEVTEEIVQASTLLSKPVPIARGPERCQKLVCLAVGCYELTMSGTEGAEIWIFAIVFGSQRFCKRRENADGVAYERFCRLFSSEIMDLEPRVASV